MVNKADVMILYYKISRRCFS